MTDSDERTSLAPLTPITYRSELIHEADPVHAGPARPQFWEIVAIQPLGAIKAQSLVFRKDGTYAAIDSVGKELWGGTFDLDPKASPKIWVHRSTEMQKQGRDALGVYELEGDKLKVCCAVVPGRISNGRANHAVIGLNRRLIGPGRVPGSRSLYGAGTPTDSSFQIELGL